MSWCRKVGRLFGRLLLALDKRTNRVIKRNLAICLPEVSEFEREQLRKKRLANIGQTLFEFGNVFLKPKEKVCCYCGRLPENNKFVEAIKSEESVIVLVPHIGNWEVMNFYLSQSRERTILYRPLKNQELDKLFCQLRANVGTKLVPINNSGVRQLVKALKKKQMVVMLPDQVPALTSGVYAPFFGEQALTMTLAHRMARSTKAKVFIAVAFQTKTGFDVSIEEVPADFYDKDALISATALNQNIEQLIKLHPVQNQWEYKRYKFGPNFLEHDLYSDLD